MFDSTTTQLQRMGAAGSDQPAITPPRNQAMPFMFEIQDDNGALVEVDGITARYTLPINPETYRIAYAPRANVTMTQSGAFEDVIGLSLPRINMQGTWGYVGPFGQDRWDDFKEMEKNFLLFYEKYGTFGLNSKPVKDPWLKSKRICFFNFTDKDYFVVQVNKFEVLRNIQRRFLYQYDIQMTVLQRLAPTKYIDAVDDYFSAVPVKPDAATEVTFASIISGIMKFMSDIVDLVSAVKADIANLVQQVAAVRAGISAFINAPFALLKSVVAGIDSIIKIVNSLATIPDEIHYNLLEVKRDILALSLRPDLFFATDTTTSSSSYTKSPVMVGDSMESLAFRTMNDGRKWDQIASANNLEHPYLADDVYSAFTPILETGALSAAAAIADTKLILSGLQPTAGEVLLLVNGQTWEAATVESYNSLVAAIVSPLKNDFPAGTTVTRHVRALKVLLPGDSAKIPQTAGQSRAIAKSDVDRLFGTDEMLNADGEHAGSGGSTTTLSGYDNLLMQLQHRLNTRRGELAALGHPTYGCNLSDIIGKISTDFWYERAIFEAETAILEDPRVQSIRNAQFTVDSTTVFLTGDIIPIGESTPSPLRITVGG